MGLHHLEDAYSRCRIRGKAEGTHGCRPINRTLPRLPFGHNIRGCYRAFCTCHLASICAGSWMDGYLHARAGLHPQRPSSLKLYPVLHESCIGRSQAEPETSTLGHNHWQRKSGVAYVPFHLEDVLLTCSNRTRLPRVPQMHISIQRADDKRRHGAMKQPQRRTQQRTCRKWNVFCCRDQFLRIEESPVG